MSCYLGKNRCPIEQLFAFRDPAGVTKLCPPTESVRKVAHAHFLRAPLHNQGIIDGTHRLLRPDQSIARRIAADSRCSNIYSRSK